MVKQVIPAGRDLETFLTQRVLSGDNEAFYELVKPCERMIYFSALSILRNDADAEEVAQEAMLKALKNLPRFRRDSRFSTWVVQITINEARMRRRKYRSHSYDSIHTPVLTAEGSYLPRDFADRCETPSAALEAKELRRAFRAALDSLPPKYREVFVLRQLRNLTTRQTAVALGMTEALVKTRLLRARLKLRWAFELL